jgi:hypothetical protein
MDGFNGLADLRWYSHGLTTDFITRALGWQVLVVSVLWRAWSTLEACWQQLRQLRQACAFFALRHFFLPLLKGGVTFGLRSAGLGLWFRRCCAHSVAGQGSLYHNSP